MAPSLFAVLATLALAAQPRTLRVDYFHTGNATEEHFLLDRLVLEPLPFPGNPDRPVDLTNLGQFLFEVRDIRTHRLLYSRGFSTIFGEWESTDEARRTTRTFSESLRFPAPAGPVLLSLKERTPGTLFREVWSLSIDPKDPAVDASPPPSTARPKELVSSGDPAQKLDLLLVGDGYTAAQCGKFEKDVQRLTTALFKVEPFRSRRSDFNVWTLCPPSDLQGVSRPLTGLHRQSKVGLTYDALGSERYLLSFENRSLRELASLAPYDALALVANSVTYGGGGIFNLFATVPAQSRFAEYIFVHELAHHLGDLADEYFDSDPAPAEARELPEPWEPNVTTDPKGSKWADLIAPGTPLPTPWPKEVFSRRSADYQARREKIRAESRPEAEMDALFLSEQREESALLGNFPFAGSVGAFEGAQYQPRGYYRPQADCIMFSRDPVPFCAVCRRALTRIIDLYTGR